MRESRRLLPSILLAILGADVVPMPEAFAQSNVGLRWGSTAPANCGEYTNFGEVVSIAPGALFSLALTAKGEVVIRECNSEPANCEVPADLGTVMAIACGYQHSMALETTGTVRVWGGAYADELQPPNGLTNVVAIAAGYENCLALEASGSLVAWGGPGELQSPPSGLSGITAIASCMQRHAARRSDGTLVSWPINTLTDAVPASIGATSDFAVGQNHGIALRVNGTVACWGAANLPQVQVPGNLGLVSAVAAGDAHNVALRANGTVVCWGAGGSGPNSPLLVPQEVRNVTSIFAGGGKSAVIMPLVDCNANGEPDSCEIRNGTLADCDGDLLPDGCGDCDSDGIADPVAIAVGITQDWNGNGIPDPCDDARMLVFRDADPLPVDLILVADTSGSMLDLITFCTAVLAPVRTTLASEFDLRLTWFNVADPTVFDESLGDEVNVFCGPATPGRYETFVINYGTEEPCLDSVVVDSDEDWGPGTCVVMNPTFTIGPSSAPLWSAREAIAIAMPLSDEGPVQGGTGEKGCSAEDLLSRDRMIEQARRWAVPIVPVVFPDSFGGPTPACVYSTNPATPGIMNEIAAGSGGSVVNAKLLGTDATANAAIAAAMITQIRDAIRISPRLLCTGDTNGDRAVNALDIAVVLGAWGTAGGSADLNDDGIVNAQDIAIVLSDWGSCLP